MSRREMVLGREMIKIASSSFCDSLLCGILKGVDKISFEKIAHYFVHVLQPLDLVQKVVNFTVFWLEWKGDIKRPGLTRLSF